MKSDTHWEFKRVKSRPLKHCVSQKNSGNCLSLRSRIMLFTVLAEICAYTKCFVCDFVHSPIINNVMRSLGALYRHQGKTEAAEIMEEYVMKTRKQVSVTSSLTIKITSTSQNHLTNLLTVLICHMTHYFYSHTFVPNDRCIIHTHETTFLNNSST